MTLAIEGVAFVFHRTVETLDWEIEEITFVKLNVEFLAGDTLLHIVVGDKMLQLVHPVVNRNIKVIISYKVGGNQGFPEACDRLRFIVEIKEGGDVDFIQYDSLIVYNANREHTVILIANRVDISSISLLYVIHLNVGSLEGFFPYPLKSRQTVSLDDKVVISIVDDRYAKFGIVGDDDANYIVPCIDPRSYSKILEQVAVLVELREAINDGLIGLS